jgi:UDPglucose 6-dehydrogenase
LGVTVAVIGEGHLADATRTCVNEHFERPTATGSIDLVWFCVDTPVDENDVPDVKFVHDELAEWLEKLTPGTPILISSQLPVGTTRKWEEEWPEHCLYYQPENIRKAHAVEDFRKQERMIVGLSCFRIAVTVIDIVLSQFTDQILWMSQESAEMTKHALNTWLAMNIAYANEIADICAIVDADVKQVFEGFTSDRRVSGPLIPGGPYTGGTLGRDVHVLERMTTEAGDELFPRFEIIRAIKFSNNERL